MSVQIFPAVIKRSAKPVGSSLSNVLNSAYMSRQIRLLTESSIAAVTLERSLLQYHALYVLFQVGDLCGPDITKCKQGRVPRRMNLMSGDLDHEWLYKVPAIVWEDSVPS